MRLFYQDSCKGRSLRCFLPIIHAINDVDCLSGGDAGYEPRISENTGPQEGQGDLQQQGFLLCWTAAEALGSPAAMRA